MSRGSNTSNRLNTLAAQLQSLCIRYRWSIRPSYTPYPQNTWANALSRGQLISSEWVLSQTSFLQLFRLQTLQVELFAPSGIARLLVFRCPFLPPPPPPPSGSQRRINCKLELVEHNLSVPSTSSRPRVLSITSRIRWSRHFHWARLISHSLLARASGKVLPTRVAITWESVCPRSAHRCTRDDILNFPRLPFLRKAFEAFSFSPFSPDARKSINACQSSDLWIISLKVYLSR